MAVKLVPTSEIKTVTLEIDDAPENEKSRFTIKGLSALDYADLLREVIATPSGEFMGLTSKGIRLCFTKGLKGWENVQDKDGKDVPYSFNNALKLPVITQSAICAHIMGNSEISEDMEKN